MSLHARVANRVTRLRQHTWRMRAYRSDQRHVVIGGSPRSGTTVLRRTFDRHPALCCGPESGVFLPGPVRVPWLAKAYGMEEGGLRRLLTESRSQGAFVDGFAAGYRAIRDKPRWAEKTPLNVWHVEWILTHFPEASFLHVIRDGRDVVCSMREYGDWRWAGGVWQRVPRSWSVEECANRWLRHTAKGMRHRGDPRYMEVRYEALVDRPTETLSEVLAFIGEAFDASMLAEPAAAPGDDPDAAGPIRGSSVGRWRRDLTPAEQATLRPMLGKRLVELGYANGNDW